MSGLGAATALQTRAFEAQSHAGGLCFSTYLDESGTVRDSSFDKSDDCFRFEPAGGHWLFGAGPKIPPHFQHDCEFSRYEREAEVFFASSGERLPFPIQENLRYLPAPKRDRALREILVPVRKEGVVPLTLKQWLLSNFGPTLCEEFFFPFNDRYTAGLYDRVAPQDAYKSPLDEVRIRQGAQGSPPRGATSSGYNAVFYYPTRGLDHLARALSLECDVRYDHRIVRIDTNRRSLHFANGDEVGYDSVVSSIPLHHMLSLSGIAAESRQDPTTAVLVVNLAATIGKQCPRSHWVYIPDSRSGLHRVGFYSNVDRSFLPQKYRADDTVLSLYAERSYPSGVRPSPDDLCNAAAAMVSELQTWQFIHGPIVMSFDFVDPAYTWSWPGSVWVNEAIGHLQRCCIRQIGRYGTWRFQGMLASFEQGLAIRHL